MKTVHELELLIKKYQDSYYSGEGEISDAEFDELWDELKQRRPDSPLLAKIGAEQTDGFPKAPHIIPMGSQEKAANEGEFRVWAEKLGLPAFVVEYKLDGASLELQYEKSVLVRAISRGDGLTGDLITANALKMQGVLAKLPVDWSGGIRGEVLMFHDVWQLKYADKANCRNAANGLMRRKDGIGCEDLTLICYDGAETGNEHFFKTEVEKINWLERCGFFVPPIKEFTSIDAIINYRAEISAKRADLAYDIDGLVVKDINTNPADLKKARPERQIAFKFVLEEAVSRLKKVEWSESGATYTPIGIVDPVRLAGTLVQRANLNNPDAIRAMGLKIGSKVVIVKRGEIIPKIERLAEEGEALSNFKEIRKKSPEIPSAVQNGIREEQSPDLECEEHPIEFPLICSACGSDLVDGGTRLYCPNPACPKRIFHRIEKWVSVLDIYELGEKLRRRLFDTGRLRKISDIYTLNVDELNEYERMGELSSAKLVRNLQTKRSITLAAFIAGFDLEGIGETIMENVTQAGFDTLEKLRAASSEEIAAVHGLGKITARTIVEGLKETAADMDATLGQGIISIEPPKQAGDLPRAGQSFCFTGELKTIKRSEAGLMVKSAGGSVKSSVVNGLSYLVTNDIESGSAKNKKARELGIPIINEEAFLNLLGTVGNES
ncbi:MAG: DNA ligase (NAD(+)) LigA [Spirochaetaceae bacterium]|jgi:DNA ligase (NAD+)|nr:DNA ligase (NAD(+)) LigA [Spirochaetaceae bacterium]